jgi:hypothetical protein
MAPYVPGVIFIFPTNAMRQPAGIPDGIGNNQK